MLLSRHRCSLSHRPSQAIDSESFHTASASPTTVRFIQADAYNKSYIKGVEVQHHHGQSLVSLSTVELRFREERVVPVPS